MKIIQQETVENLLATVKPYIYRIKEETRIDNAKLYSDHKTSRNEARAEYKKAVEQNDLEYKEEVKRLLGRRRDNFGFHKYTKEKAQRLARKSFPHPDMPEYQMYYCKSYPTYYDVLNTMLYDLERLDQNQTVVLTIEQAIAMKEIVNESTNRVSLFRYDAFSCFSSRTIYFYM